MPNWFERNATPTIIGYTLLIAGSTWGASTFILQDSRLNSAQSELASEKALTEQYKSKLELVQRDLEELRNENKEYRDWLGQTKDAIPVVVPRIMELKGDIAALKAEVASLRAANQYAEPEVRECSATVGSAFIDDTTGLIFTVKRTAPDQTADVLIHFPGSGSPNEFSISPGFQRVFLANGKSFTLTVTSINFVGDIVQFRLQPNKGGRVK